MSQSAAAGPYVGLQPYTEATRAYFFGREAKRRVIAASLLSARLTVLYGASGVGKSSLLHAGLVPYLRALPDMLVVPFQTWTPGDSRATLDALKRAIADAANDAAHQPTSPDSSAPLDEFISQIADQSGRSLAILLDQFEDYLAHPHQDGNQFDAEFRRAITRDNLNANFLIAVRADALPIFHQRYQAALANLSYEPLRLEPLKRAEAMRAIRKPLDAYNAQHKDAPVIIDADLIEKLLALTQANHAIYRHEADDSSRRAGDDAIEASYLQLLLTRLWHKAVEGDRVMSLTHLKQLGGAEAIVRDYLFGVMSQLDETTQAACAAFFPHLVTPTGTTVELTLDDIGAYAGHMATSVERLLESLERAYMLRALMTQANLRRFEIFHPLIAPAILDWARQYTEEREREREAQRRAEAERRRAEEEARARWLEAERTAAEQAKAEAEQRRAAEAAARRAEEARAQADRGRADRRRAGRRAGRAIARIERVARPAGSVGAHCRRTGPTRSHRTESRRLFTRAGYRRAHQPRRRSGAQPATGDAGRRAGADV